MKELNLGLEQSLHFNEGQKLTPEQLNALSDFARNRDVLLTRLLFGTEGIVVGYESELQVKVVNSDSMALQVLPGAAVNANGETLILQEITLLDLNKKATGTEPVNYYIQLIPEEILESPFTDSEIPELRGYRFKRWVTRLKVSRQLEPRAAEVARVLLDTSVKRLKVISENQLSSTTQAGVGVVDDRLAPRFQVYSRSHLTFADHQHIRNAAREFRAMLIRLRELFPRAQSMSPALECAFLIEVEVSDTFFQAKKVDFLLGELKKCTFELIDELRDMTKGSKNYPEQVWSHLFERAEKFSAGTGQASRTEFTVLNEVSFTILEKILKTATEKDRQVMIRESLSDIRGFDFGMHLQHSFGGVLFRLKDSAQDEDLFKRVQAETDFSTMKNLSASYLNGVEYSGRGAFYSEGKLHLKVAGLRPGMDGLVLLRLYKRRGVKEYSLTVNGNNILRETMAPNEAVDKFLHVGALVNGSLITAGENLLTLDIQRVDLDFGLFGVFVYQEQEGSLS